tara:strand:- start:93 stop:314 length:222 start_codon:yes stop_codon:yes gene_type:complete
MQREGGQVNVTCLWIDDDIADILSAVDTVTGQATRLTPKEINAIHRFDLEENLELVGSNHELFIIDGGENGSE